MKILYIIGNGFDINIGMKTRYSDFYEYYNSIESKSKLINDLKIEISKNINTWADLELALGRHTDRINSLEEFEEIYYDIANNLGDYLQKQEDEFDFNGINEKSFLRDLCFPEKHLPQEDSDALKLFKEQWNKSQWDVDIITLNYTKSIEKIIGNQETGLEIGMHNFYQIILKGIQHLHGYTDNRMIMGVNDLSQISNKNFHDNIEISEAIIKPNCNMVQRHGVDKLCATQITSADLICIFGSSIGETDNYWWGLVGERLKKGARIIIFSKGEEIKQRFGHQKAKIERAIRNRFLSKSMLDNDEGEAIAKNIYIGINTDMFRIT